MRVKINESWRQHLEAEFEKDYFQNLVGFVKQEYQTKTVYPKPKDIFKAFDLCGFDDVKVIILGQDPYHGQGQANGLCFSVGEKVAVPPSLQNIYKEISADLAVPASQSGDLNFLAKQGVLLLNATLTVAANMPGSHQRKGWEEFTDAIVKTLSDQKTGLVFLLWGKYAEEKGRVIDTTKHLVLKAAHPSPYSASAGFFGCKHFSKANTYLKTHGRPEINWTH